MDIVLSLTICSCYVMNVSGRYAVINCPTTVDMTTATNIRDSVRAALMGPSYDCTALWNLDVQPCEREVHVESISGKTWYCWGPSCFHFRGVTGHKAAGDTYCSSLTSHIVAVETENEMNMLMHLYSQYGLGPAMWFWNDLINDKTWSYSGTISNYYNWNPGEPLNDQSSLCTVMRLGNDGLWDDLGCTWTTPDVVCEIDMPVY